MNTVSVSKMTGKLLGIEAINTNPLSNDFCKSRTEGICAKCYSRKSLSTYRRNCVQSFERNSVSLSSGQLDVIPLITTRICRLSAHGELINHQHYQNLLAIVKIYADIRFALWTKRPDLITGSKPPNLRLVFSVTEIDGKHYIPDGFDTSYRVISSGLSTCSGKCISCLKCWSAIPAIDCLIRGR